MTWFFFAFLIHLSILQIQIRQFLAFMNWIHVPVHGTLFKPTVVTKWQMNASFIHSIILMIILWSLVGQYNLQFVYSSPHFGGGCFRKFCPYVWSVFKSSLYSRAGYDVLRTAVNLDKVRWEILIRATIEMPKKSGICDYNE